MHVAGGPEAFLEQYAVIVASDHSQAAVEERIRLDQAFEDFDVAAQSAASGIGAEVALSPAQRAAMIYVLDEDRRGEILERSVQAAGAVPGVDLVLWLNGEGESREAVVRSARGELRLAPGGELEDERGGRWSIEGELAALGIREHDGRVTSDEYPAFASRIWSALNCSRAGDVLLSASPGYEFVDWGGADHVGGGSHGSLHRSDSLGALLWCGTGPDSRQASEQWTLADVAPMVRRHFGVDGQLGHDRGAGG
jgi:hypothetical protein